jgi:hypothetical protein
MTDKEDCARMTMGFEPLCSLPSLLDLLALLRSTGL